MKETHFLVELQEHYPRLKEVPFSFSDKDVMKIEITPAGEVESLYFDERADFENAIIALAYRLQPRPIPASTGAMFLSGLADYVEMRKKKIILLSRGGYSGLTGKDVGMDEDEWIDNSLIIRKFHELAHFNQRTLIPENTDALVNEIVADMTGLIAAFGRYDGRLARIFLGIEGKTYRKGGRLENYLPDGVSIEAFSESAEEWIQRIEKMTEGWTDPFECQMMVEKEIQKRNQTSLK